MVVPCLRLDIEGSIVLPQGHKGPAFLVYDNFRIILEWNRSINYAFCVGYLADRLVGLPEIANGKNADHEPLSRFEIKEIQWHLNFLGFEAGSVDGLIGPNTKPLFEPSKPSIRCRRMAIPLLVC